MTCDWSVRLIKSKAQTLVHVIESQGALYNVGCGTIGLHDSCCQKQSWIKDVPKYRNIIMFLYLILKYNLMYTCKCIKHMPTLMHCNHGNCIHWISPASYT